MKKKLIALLLALALCAGLVACGNTDAPNTDTPNANTPSTNAPSTDSDYTYPKLKLTLTAQGAETGGINITSRYMIDLIEEKSGGQITFEEYFNATLASGTDTLATVGEGIADAADIVTLYTVSALPLAQIAYCVPFSSDDPALEAELMMRMWEAHPEFVQEYINNGVYPLFIKGIENYGLQFNFKVEENDLSLEMFNGKKASCGGVYYHYWFDALGSTFVSGTAATVYNDLNNNLININMTYPSLVCDFKTYEVSDSYVDAKLGTRACHIWGININTWNSFDDQTKALFEECAAEAQKMYYAWLKDSTDTWMNEIKTSNNIVAMSDELRAEWAEVALEYFDTMQLWIDTVTDLGYDGAAMMSDYLKIGQELGIEYLFDTSAYIVN